MADIPAVTQPVVETSQVAPVIPGVQTSPPNEVIVPPVQNIAPAVSQVPPAQIVEPAPVAAQLTIDAQSAISAVDAAYGRT